MMMMMITIICYYYYSILCTDIYANPYSKIILVQGYNTTKCGQVHGGLNMYGKHCVLSQFVTSYVCHTFPPNKQSLSSDRL